MKALAAALVCVAAGACPSASACAVRDVARVPLTRTSAGLLLAPVAIDGKPAELLLDTGAERTVLGAAAVVALGLKLDDWVSTGMEGVGGIERRRNADVSSFTLGGRALRRRALAGVVSLPVAGSLGQAFPDAGAGLLGMDLLSTFDLEVDPAGPVLTLHSVQDCAGRFLPWSGGYAAVPASLPRVGVMVAPVTVNGVTLRALIDTGSQTTVVDSRAARRLGIVQGAGGQARGLGPDALATRAATLSELRLGTAVWRPAPVVVALLPSLGYDMVLGMDVLGTRRVWVSFAASELFVADGG